MLDIKVFNPFDEDDRNELHLINSARKMHCILHDISEWFYKNETLEKDKFVEIEELNNFFISNEYF